MTPNVVRAIMGIVALAAVLVAAGQGGALLAQSGHTLTGLLLPVGLLAGALATAIAFYYALVRQPNIYKGFRVVVGVICGAVIYWLLGSVALDVQATLGQAFSASSLTLPLAKVIVAIAIAVIYYFGLVASTGPRRLVENIFSIPDLLKKIGFTVLLLCIYRVGYHIPLPGINQEQVAAQQEGSPLGQALAYFAMFTGGNLQQSTLFGLGIMPYISASIIFQLLVTVYPPLERLQKEGQAGYRKIQEYTRYATVFLCVMQAAIWMRYLHGSSMIYPQYAGSMWITLMGIMGLTTGTMFLMWLGEQIDEYGIGNGISLIIMAGIVARLPWAIRDLLMRASLKVTGAESSEIGLIKIVFLVAAFVFVVSGSILITQATRRIPIQQAKQTRGRRVYGGQRQYLPLRVNIGGVMPIIFASSLMLFPSMIMGWIVNMYPRSGFLRYLHDAFMQGHAVNELSYIALIFFFAFFWTTVQFRPKDMAEQLQDMGHFIPGLRPGKRTADYLEKVMERITYCGAAFLAVIAVIPQVLANSLNIPWSISAFLGGTGLLIMVSVALDVVQRIDSNLIMRNYGGFLGETGRIRGSR